MANGNKPEKVMIEGASIIFRNFEGKESQYNTKGQRNFAVILDENNAEKLLREGWNVKRLNPQEEGDIPVPYIPVAVNFKNRPPRIVMISSSSRTNLNEDTVEVLDWADIRNVDLIFNAYNWEVGDKVGKKAYLKSMYVTIEEDELERKYAEMEG